MIKKWMGFSLFVAAAFSTAWLSQGCLSHLPTLASVVPTPLPSGVVSDFDNGTLNMNPNLLGSATGYFQTLATGANNIVNPPSPPAPPTPCPTPPPTNTSILAANPGDGSHYAVHVYGPQYDPPPTTYPAFNLYGFLKRDNANPYYDLSLFTHVQFDFNIPFYTVCGGVTTGDNNPQKRFAIAIAPQVPPTTDAGGTCLNSANCYNFFWAPGNLPNTTGWQTSTFALTSLTTDPYYGYALSTSPTPFGARPTDWTTALFLLWKFGDNGAGSTTNVDFWVDNVKFY